MINYETILSTFDDKLTLMQWLQKVEQALEGAGLESVEIHQQTPTTAYFKFVFADGTSVTTPSITLPRGAKGDTGATGATGATGNGIASISKTGSSGLVDIYTILYTNGSTQTFNVTNGAQGEAGQDGQDGTDGVGISNVSVATSGVVTVTLTDTSTINAGNVFSIVSLGSGTSGTLTTGQLDAIKLVNTVITDSNGNAFKYHHDGGTYIDYLCFDPVSCKTSYYTIQKDTGAWAKTTEDFEATIFDVSTQMLSDGATLGQVPTADGNGGVSWQNAGGGTLYQHFLNVFDGATMSGFSFTFISTSSTKINSLATLANWLYTNNFKTTNAWWGDCLTVYGAVRTGGTTYRGIIGLSSTNGTSINQAWFWTDSSGWSNMTYGNCFTNSATYVDNVIQIN